MARKTKPANRGKAVKKTPDADASLRNELEELLNGGNAHAPLEKVVAGFPAKLQGET